MGRVLATSDWHGCDFYQEVLNVLDEDDKIYFLGDAIDRGDAGIDTFHALYNDERVIFMKGNHEDMLAQFLTRKDLIESQKEIIVYNGTDKTLESINKIPQEQRLDYAKIINAMPERLIYHSPRGHAIVLEHAGFSPFSIPHRTHDPIWDRFHFQDEWDEGYKFEGLNPKKTYVVHGHTPVQLLRFNFGYINKEPLLLSELKEKQYWDKEQVGSYKPHILNYCYNHKFDIDMCTAVSNRIAFLDLDTFEEIYFDEENMRKLTK